MAYLGAAALGGGLGYLASRSHRFYTQYLPRRIAQTYQRVQANRAQRRAQERVRLASMNRTFSPRFAKDQALKLGRLTYPCVLKEPLSWIGPYSPSGVNDGHYTMTCRLQPFGRCADVSGIGQAGTTLFMGDTRFRTLCSLYSEFHIVSVTFNVQVISPSGDNFPANNTGTVQNNDITIFANVIRNCPYSMQYTGLQTNDFLSVPGIIWRRPKTSVSYPSLKVTIREKTLEEKMQWLPTNNTGQSQTNWLADDPAIKWFPALDIAFNTARGWGGTNRIYYSVVCRAIVKFRSGKLPTASAGGTSKEQISRAESREVVSTRIPPGTNVEDVAHLVMGYEGTAPVVNDV